MLLLFTLYSAKTRPGGTDRLFCVYHPETSGIFPEVFLIKPGGVAMEGHSCNSFNHIRQSVRRESFVWFVPDILPSSNPSCPCFNR